MGMVFIGSLLHSIQPRECILDPKKYCRMTKLMTNPFSRYNDVSKGSLIKTHHIFNAFDEVLSFKSGAKGHQNSLTCNQLSVTGDYNI